jgi:peroxiredoxin
MAALQIGDKAPDFSLTAVVQGVRRLFHLSQHRDRYVVVLFHSLNWSPSSEQMIRAWNQHREAVEACGAEIIAISVDSVFNTGAWEKAIGPVGFSLGVDYWPHGATAEQFGVLRTEGEDAGTAENAVFLVDKSGRIAFARVSPAGETPDPGEVIAELRKLNSAVA